MLAMAACLAGCGKDRIVEPPVRHLPPAPSPQPYPTLSEPEKVMEALRKAYPLGDTTEIKSIYDIDYQGTWFDENDRSPMIATIYRQGEIQHASYLAHHPELRVTIATSPVLTRTSDLSEPPGWAILMNPLDSLSVTDFLGRGYTVDFANDTMEFHFIPYTPDSSSPTDTTWKIVRWIETRRKVP
jgi:hypothetical protein